MQFHHAGANMIQTNVSSWEENYILTCTDLTELSDEFQDAKTITHFF
jgi:hypothetical protein